MLPYRARPRQARWRRIRPKVWSFARHRLQARSVSKSRRNALPALAFLFDGGGKGSETVVTAHGVRRFTRRILPRAGAEASRYGGEMRRQAAVRADRQAVRRFGAPSGVRASASLIALPPPCFVVERFAREFDGAGVIKGRRPSIVFIAARKIRLDATEFTAAGSRGRCALCQRLFLGGCHV